MPDNLPELRDIHLPDGVSAFPFAYGWWVIAVGLIVLAVLIRAGIVLRQRSKKRYALGLIEKLSCDNPVAAAAAMSEILRRSCLEKYPEAASLSGKDWKTFLTSKTSAKICDKTASLLKDAPYMPLEQNFYTSESAEELKVFCRQWIGENL